MEKKMILFSDGTCREMSFEEILEQFDKLIQNFANSTIEKIIYNKPEKEEILQELRIQVWIAFKRYNGKNAFSTYLFYRLQHGIARFTMKLYAQKRTNTAGSVSLNEVMSNDDSELELGGLLGEEDLEISSLPFREFISELEKLLNPCEKKMLMVLINKHEFSVQDLASELGMSRQGANKKINKFRERMADILRQKGYVTC